MLKKKNMLGSGDVIMSDNVISIEEQRRIPLIRIRQSIPFLN